jgi:hypothetical protein
MTEDRAQRTEGRGQRIDDRDQRTGGEGQIVEVKKLRRWEVEKM